MCMMSILYMAEELQSRLAHVQLVHIAATVYAGARAVVDWVLRKLVEEDAGQELMMTMF